MELLINPRGNGACPLCTSNTKCVLQKTLKDAMEKLGKKDEMEIVIYTCPKFKEIH
jgi:hypothetical protein